MPAALPISEIPVTNQAFTAMMHVDYGSINNQSAISCKWVKSRRELDWSDLL
jgi:hypothetical protein